METSRQDQGQTQQAETPGQVEQREQQADGLLARVGAAGLRLASALTLVMGISAPALGSTALAQTGAQTWEVQVGGGGAPGGPPMYEAMAYGPGPVIIRAGDTVSWKFAGVHTVTFNSGKPDLPLVLPGPAQGEAQLGPAALPMGVTGSGPVMYDGTQQVNSGAPLQGPPEEFAFSMTFTKPGLYGYVCTLHPGMRAEVEVREANASLPETPAQAKTRGVQTLQTLANKVKTAAEMAKPISASTTQVVQAGLGDGFGASALAFLNGDRTVRRGDTVVWVGADPFEIHTVTFPGAGQQAPEFVTPRPQAGGPPALVIPANVAGPVGGEVYTGGYANSGIFSSGGGYGLRFDVAPGAYNYLCVVHPWMTGTITVIAQN